MVPLLLSRRSEPLKPGAQNNTLANVLKTSQVAEYQTARSTRKRARVEEGDKRVAPLATSKHPVCANLGYDRVCC